MGNCGNCKGSCPSKPVDHDCCSTGGKSYPVREKTGGLTSFLKSPPKSKGDPTPLTHPCDCFNSPRAPRYACLNCLRKWATAHTFEEIEAQIVELREYRSRIAADRLESILKDLRQTRRIEDE